MTICVMSHVIFKLFYFRVTFDSASGGPHDIKAAAALTLNY